MVWRKLETRVAFEVGERAFWIFGVIFENIEVRTYCIDCREEISN